MDMQPISPPRILRLFRHRILTAACLAAGLAGTVLGVRDVSAQARRSLLLGAGVPSAIACGTGVERARSLGFRPLTAAASGDGISFEQSPSILSPDYSGTITLRRFMVAGDVPSIRIRLMTEAHEVQEWPRTGTERIAGQTVSLFEPSWPSATLSAVLRAMLWGWEYPGLEWGELLPPSGTGEPTPITLRIATASLPVVRVQRLADNVQYSSSVVNIVLPGFGSQYALDDHGFEFTDVARIFYQHFADSYDSLALIPQDMFLSDYSGFHRNVRNDVTGIGLEVFDDSARYGSQSGRLRSLELFSGMQGVTNSTVAHEIAHQWGAYIDWTRLTGLGRSGHQPMGHDPLWSEGETFLGSLLVPQRRVKRTSAGWEIERTPAPARFHPMTLYAMGLIGPEQVPEVTLFDDQAQLGADQYWPDPGRAITGPTRTATIYNVIGMLGPRSGPIHREWHRATIVVSRERPLSQREMDYWTFFAQRIADPNRTGLPGFFETSSFDEAARRLIDLRSEIVPLSGAPIVEPLPVDSPMIGRRDFRDVIFDAPLKTRYRAGERVNWSGVVDTIVADPSDYSHVAIQLWKSEGTADDALVSWADVTSAKSFSTSLTLAARSGVYVMRVYLFRRGEDEPASWVTITPIIIE
jgi:hypothetical protein